MLQPAMHNTTPAAAITTTTPCMQQQQWNPEKESEKQKQGGVTGVGRLGHFPDQGFHAHSMGSWVGGDEGPEGVLHTW